MKLLVFFFTLITVFDLYAKPGYYVRINLNKTKDDKVMVELYPPVSEREYVTFHIPKVVPGTYDVSNFGQFLSNFKAFDSLGTELETHHLSTNKWQIKNDGKLYKISYSVNDTYDRFGDYGDDTDEIIFEPGGTNFDKKRNVFILNTFGLIGYIDEMKFQPYELEIIHPKEIYGATALKKESKSDTLDAYFAEDYNFLADGPIMYSVPDTITQKIGGATVSVSVHSPNHLVTAAEVMERIYDLMVAQAAYLGGELPVDRYSYLVYLIDRPKLTLNFGALEHSYSTVFYLFEGPIRQIGKYVRDIAAHEFFHIVTPLNIHSEEIGNFNYINPKMSKHLWLYEGVTEYSSLHVQVKYGLYDEKTFFDEIKTKIINAKNYPEISFTKMSEHILEPEYRDVYQNVYEKGTLIAMCLDLYLLKYSNGTYDLQALIKDLSQQYGKNNSFKDDELFDIIEELTYPEIGAFFEQYVVGATPLPLDKVFSWVGLKLTRGQEEITVNFLGNAGLDLDDEQKFVITDVSLMNAFGNELGYKEGDIIHSINGQEMTIESATDIIKSYQEKTNPGDKVIIEVYRKNKRGKLKKKKLKARAFRTGRVNDYQIEVQDKTTPNQDFLRNKWLIADPLEE